MPLIASKPTEQPPHLDWQNPYLLLTPGPLSTSPSVRAAMLRDWCTWDETYNLGVVTPIREKLVALASAADPNAYTAVLMQGSGTFSVESMIGSTVTRNGKLLALANGEYGNRLGRIARTLEIETVVHDSGELAPPDLDLLDTALASDTAITHVVCVHTETTTGMLNPLAAIARIVKRHQRLLLVDSMSAFGGIPMDVADLDIDFLVSSANKCLEGVPGFGFVIAKKSELARCAGRARSVSLDLYDQWQGMEKGHGKWRFTSPTHVVRAFAQALKELDGEGGVVARCARYTENQRRLVHGMETLGFRCLLPPALQSPIITAFHDPVAPGYEFARFYDQLKSRGFVIYPGKVTGLNSFRIGTIGQVFPEDIDRLITAIEKSRYWA
jgi:2-aminoethylphosphonate-pyruvate transaminase